MLATRISSKSTPDFNLSCGNPRDVRKKILVKVFAGSIWEARLLEFVYTFTKRREEFESALDIHITVDVDAADPKLDTPNERTAEPALRQAAFCIP
jgi:hypothetical protein